MAIATQRTRRAGAAISISCCRHAPRCGQSSTMPRWRTPAAVLPGELAHERSHCSPRAGVFNPHGCTHRRVIGARWNEIDLLDKTWMAPATRMKAHRERRVPLSPRALSILGELQAAGQSDDKSGFVFQGSKPGTPLSNMAFLMLLRRMGLDDLTVHGFRSTFRDWAAERTNYPNHVVEMALAHAVSNKVEQAYRRGDLFEKRRRLMQQWATYCTAAPTTEPRGKVTALRGQA